MYASKILKNNSYKVLVRQIGMFGIESYQDENLSWPCDKKVGQHPGLMTGLAGIGYFYLRLYSSLKIPSVLLIGHVY